MLKQIFALTGILVLGAMMFLPATAQALVIPKERPQLVQESTTILTGQVTALRSFWNKGHERIYTEVTVLVHEYLKGNEGSLIKFTVPGGTVDNSKNYGPYVSWNKEVIDDIRVLMNDAQTSGGLLIFVPGEKKEKLVDALGKEGILSAYIGDIVDRPFEDGKRIHVEP